MKGIKDSLQTGVKTYFTSKVIKISKEGYDAKVARVKSVISERLSQGHTQNCAEVHALDAVNLLEEGNELPTIITSIQVAVKSAGSNWTFFIWGMRVRKT
jgi:hypothetical protein